MKRASVATEFWSSLPTTPTWEAIGGLSDDLLGHLLDAATVNEETVRIIAHLTQPAGASTLLGVLKRCIRKGGVRAFRRYVEGMEHGFPSTCVVGGGEEMHRPCRWCTQRRSRTQLLCGTFTQSWSEVAQLSDDLLWSLAQQPPHAVWTVAHLGDTIDTRESAYTYLDVLVDYASVGRMAGLRAFKQLCGLNRVVRTVDSQPGEWEEPTDIPGFMLAEMPPGATDFGHGQVPYVAFRMPGHLSHADLVDRLGRYGYAVVGKNLVSDAIPLSYVRYTDGSTVGEYVYTKLRSGRIDDDHVFIIGSAARDDDLFLGRVQIAVGQPRRRRVGFT
jgi:hypothetical protein